MGLRSTFDILADKKRSTQAPRQGNKGIILHLTVAECAEHAKPAIVGVYRSRLALHEVKNTHDESTGRDRYIIIGSHF